VLLFFGYDIWRQKNPTFIRPVFPVRQVRPVNGSVLNLKETLRSQEHPDSTRNREMSIYRKLRLCSFVSGRAG
jgi:hypothetical protein